jgi:hypothetical protein
MIRISFQNEELPEEVHFRVEKYSEIKVKIENQNDKIIGRYLYLL